MMVCVCPCVCVFCVPVSVCAVSYFLYVCYPVHVCINLCVIQIHSTTAMQFPSLTSLYPSIIHECPHVSFYVRLCICVCVCISVFLRVCVCVCVIGVAGYMTMMVMLSRLGWCVSHTPVHKQGNCIEKWYRPLDCGVDF